MVLLMHKTIEHLTEQIVNLKEAIEDVYPSKRTRPHIMNLALDLVELAK